MKAIFKKCCGSTLFMVVLLFGVHFLSAQVTVNGEGINGDEMMLYHKVVLTVDGPSGTENEATFKDYRMTVVFVNGTTSHTISGYFAADGNAANTGATSGNKWRCNFRPEKTGTWNYTILFRQGTGIALKVNTDNSGSTALTPDGTTGSFTIGNSNKMGKDFRNPLRGPLKYVNKHQLKYSGSDNYFVRAGMGVPEALFAYSDFDNTPNAKLWTAHASHYDLDPSPELLWQNGKGKNMMGAANYTIQQGANTLYGVMYNTDGGDGADSRFPWTTPIAKTTFDVSKLEQWDRILTHFNNVGAAFIFMFAETENESGLNDTQLKLWYREAAARFGHHSAISFVLCEEMKTTTVANASSLCDFLKGVDGHDRHRGIHTPGNDAAHAQYYQPMATHANSNYACVQTREANYSDIYAATKKIRDWSTGAGKTPWLISVDEARIAGQVSLNTDAVDPNHNTDRINALWGNLMGGGMGVSMYTTANGGDGGMVSFVEFKNFLNQCGAAIDFFWDYKIPLGDMAPNDALVSTGRCLAAKGIAYVVHLPTGGSPTLNLTGETGNFNVLWLDTKTGEVKPGSVTSVTGGGTQSLGNAPAGLPTDKVILVTKGNSVETFTLSTSAQNGIVETSPAGGTYVAGSVVYLTANANLGYQFSGWSGSPVTVTGLNTAEITMNANKSVTANFVPVPTYTLNATAVNGSVTLNPAGGTYNEGEVVTLTAVPAAGYKFDSWSGALTGKENPKTITMNSNKNLTANFSVETSLIKNGDFSSGTADWSLSLTGTIADADFYVISREAYIEMIVAGMANTDVIFEQTGINLIIGHNYTLSFDARAESNRDVVVKCVSEGVISEDSFPNQTKSIATSMNTLSHTWTHNASSGPCKLQFLLGAGGQNDVWLDNIKLIDNTVLSQNSFEDQKSNKKEDIYIYPNPASETLNIVFADAESNKQIKIYNVIGELLHSTQTKKANASVDVKALNLKGVAVVKIEINGLIYINKIIVK